MVNAHEAFRELLAVCPPPSEAAGEALAPVEHELGLEIPDDFHRLMEVYGPGCFDEFLWLFGCFPQNRNLDIRERTARARRVFLRSASVRCNRMLSELGAGRDDIVSWGATDNGDLCVWVAAGPPGQWPIAIIDVREDSYLLFEGSVSEFLVAVLHGDVRSSILPEDFPSASPRFSVNPYGSD